MRATRALMALVIVMGVLIVLGTTGLVVVVIHRLAHPHPPAFAAATVPVPGTPALAQEPPGTRITALSRQSDTLLAIALTGGGPDRVLIWDLAANHAVSELTLGR